ncbi:MAG: molybdopterin-dependent oxidoreductase, partial [Chloroflexi bacterium]|nr:molybdopterin-dependent oxidoreductase [Chloroflexota bacterium]
FSARGASNYLAQTVGAQIQKGPRLTRHDAFPDGGQEFDVERALAVLKARVDADSMVLIQQEIYSNALTDFADMLLPAAPWGEEEFARMQAERRLRMYSKFMDPPGEAKPDWWIIAQVAQKMGFEGYDWKDSNEIFEEASERSKGGVHDYSALVEMARAQGIRAHDLLRKMGTTGIQCPIKMENGELVGTVRIHEDKFGTASGKAVFPKGDWNEVEPFQRQFAPQGDELWVTNMRMNEHWQSQFDDARIPYRWERFPANVLEINPADASSRSIESGDEVEVVNNDVLTQTGGKTTGRFTAVAYVTDQVPPGVTCGYFLFGQGRLDMAVNSVAPGQADPINNRYRYKLGKGVVTRTGESEFKHTMSFVPRNLT